MAARLLADVFNAEDHPPTRKALEAIGLSSNLIDRVIAEERDIDPKPNVTYYLNGMESIDMDALLQAGQIHQETLLRLERSLSEVVTAWPEAITQLDTPLGAIYVGTTNADMYHQEALLILDPAGNDTYRQEAGAVNGLQGGRLASVIDLRGDDRYEGSGLVGPGAALFGISFILDGSGDDLYRCAYMGQEADVFGIGWLEDRAGDDTYRARAMAQAAGYEGLGLLRDGAGHDLYEVGFYGQGFAGVRGLGLFLDKEGNDRYFAGGRLPDYGRNPGRYLSLAQGFSIGLRPFAGGGVAALIDVDK